MARVTYKQKVRFLDNKHWKSDWQDREIREDTRAAKNADWDRSEARMSGFFWMAPTGFFGLFSASLLARAYELNSQQFVPATSAGQITKQPETSVLNTIVNEAIDRQKPADKTVSVTQTYKFDKGAFVAEKTDGIALSAQKKSIDVKKFNSEVQVAKENITTVGTTAGGITAVFALVGAGLVVKAFFKARKAENIINSAYKKHSAVEANPVTETAESVPTFQIVSLEF